MVKDGELLHKIEHLIKHYSYETSEKLDEIENVLLFLLDANKDDINLKIQYALVLLSEPILDYDKAHALLNGESDIRSVLLTCFIEDSIYGELHNVDIDKVISFNPKCTAAEISSLYYYKSLNFSAKLDRIQMLQKSLHDFNFHFLSILDLKKISNQESLYIDVDRKYFNCEKLIRKLNKSNLLKNKLYFKTFFYAKLLGLERDEENLKLLKDMYF